MRRITPRETHRRLLPRESVGFHGAHRRQVTSSREGSSRSSSGMRSGCTSLAARSPEPGAGRGMGVVHGSTAAGACAGVFGPGGGTRRGGPCPWPIRREMEAFVSRMRRKYPARGTDPMTSPPAELAGHGRCPAAVLSGNRPRTVTDSKGSMAVQPLRGHGGGWLASMGCPLRDLERTEGLRRGLVIEPS